MKKIIKISLSLFFVCFIAVGALAAVESLTRERIRQNGEQEIQRALSILIPDAQYTDITEQSEADAFNSEGEFENTVITQVFRADGTDGAAVGYIVVLNTQGYMGEIGLRVGILRDGTVSGVVVGENPETPGLGANISRQEWLDQFRGGSAPFDFTSVDKITSATYSSKYVMRGVNAACAFVERLRGEQG